jgi:hypothetical protein
MTKTNDNLESSLEKLYAQVPAPPEGLAAGRERMLAEAARLKERAALSLSTNQTTEIQKSQRRRKMKLFLAYKIITAVMAVVMGATAAGGGVALASADSLPGDALYPVKLIVEDARLALTADPAAQAELTLAFVAERCQEMQQLAAQGESVPEDVLARTARQTEQVMAQIAQAQPEDVPGLLARVVERTRTQQQVLEQVRAAAPEEAQPALRRALEVTARAYETANAGRQDPEQFQNEYQNQYRSTPGPHGQASPSVTPTAACETCTPEQNQEQNRERERNQNETATPTGTPEPDQDRARDRDQDQNQTHTPEPSGPCETCTPEQDRDRDRDRDQTCTPEPPGPCETCTPEQDRERERNQTHTPEPMATRTPAQGGGPGGGN